MKQNLKQEALVAELIWQRLTCYETYKRTKASSSCLACKNQAENHFWSQLLRSQLLFETVATAICSVIIQCRFAWLKQHHGDYPRTFRGGNPQILAGEFSSKCVSSVFLLVTFAVQTNIQ